tara:strand:- start:31 stop:213 length:183 start_codon:yes stop_codon:yes gene_type:complete
MWVLIMVVMLGNTEPIDSSVKTFETEKQCYNHLSKLELSYKNSQFDPPVLRCETASVKAP